MNAFWTFLPAVGHPRRVIRFAAVICCASLLSSCTSTVSISRRHDLQPGELRGSVAIHALSEPRGDAERNEAMRQSFARHLQEAGLTPVPADRPADWHFEWTEMTNSKPLLIASLKMRSRDGRVRWMGSCSETGTDDGSSIRSTRRIRILMGRFPGENQTSERMGMRLVPTPGDLSGFIGSLGNVLGAAASGGGG